MVFESPALMKIQGQPRAVALLGQALETDRVAHAYAFVGPAGAGRTTTALAFAAALLCERRGCDACRACKLVAARQHPDLHVIVPTPPETNPRGARAIRIAAIREVGRQAALRPAMAGRKVFIIDDAERMTGEAPPAFLKTLEEPPDHTVMILILPRLGALPATVLSRCHVVRFDSREDRSAQRAEALELLADVRAGGVEALFRRSEKIDRERAAELVEAYALYCRDLLLAKAGAPSELLTNGTSATDTAREAETWTIDELLQTLTTCREARQALATNVAPRLTIEVLLAQIGLRAA